MDEARKLLVVTCQKLIKTQARLIELQSTPKLQLKGGWERVPSWAVSDLRPPSPWLEGCPPNTSVSGVISAISLVMVHLLALVESGQPVNPQIACIALQHLSMEGYGGEWNKPVVRLAKRLGIELPSRAWDWHHGLSLHHRELTK